MKVYVLKYTYALFKNTILPWKANFALLLKSPSTHLVNSNITLVQGRQGCTCLNKLIFSICWFINLHTVRMRITGVTLK